MTLFVAAPKDVRTVFESKPIRSSVSARWDDPVANFTNQTSRDMTRSIEVQSSTSSSMYEEDDEDDYEEGVSDDEGESSISME